MFPFVNGLITQGYCTFISIKWTV